MADRPRIVVLGSINMDLVATTPALPQPGETVMGDAASRPCRGARGRTRPSRPPSSARMST